MLLKVIIKFIIIIVIYHYNYSSQVEVVVAVVLYGEVPPKLLEAIPTESDPGTWSILVDLVGYCENYLLCLKS